MTRARFNLSLWSLEHPALVRYLMVVLLVMGVAAYFQLGQDEDPPFSWRAMVIKASWPGATASQMADQVSDKIERVLQEIPYAEKIRSYSKPGETTIIFQLRDSSPAAEVTDLWTTVRKKVGDMQSTLPAGVLGPFFNDDFGDTFGVIYALSAPGYTTRDVRDFAKTVRQALLRVPDVGKVEIYGLQDERLYIELSRARLAQYRLTVAQVIAAAEAQNSVLSAGALQATDKDIPLRLESGLTSVEALRALPLRIGGQVIRVGDIAQVVRSPRDPPVSKLRYQGQEVVGLGISMRKGGDVVALGKTLAGAVRDVESRLPAGVTLARIQDQPAVVEESVREFIVVLMEAIAIVLGVSLLTLGLHRHPWRIDPRPGLVVAISIPLVLAVTFLIMKLWGVGLHKISLGSLIIALGLLVDDAIIVVEMMVRKLEQGADRVSAVTAAYALTAMPMLTGTLITAAGFLPIGLAKSAVGEYTFAIFAVTAASLLVSWLVSVIFVPYLGHALLRVPPPSRSSGSDRFTVAFVVWSVGAWTAGRPSLCLRLPFLGLASSA